MTLETASVGGRATGIAETVADKPPKSNAVAHASFNLDICVSSGSVRPCMKGEPTFLEAVSLQEDWWRPNRRLGLQRQVG